MAKTPNRSVRLDPDLDARVQAFADHHHLPWSQALRVLLRRYFTQLDGLAHEPSVVLEIPPGAGKVPPQRKETSDAAP